MFVLLLFLEVKRRPGNIYYDKNNNNNNKILIIINNAETAAAAMVQPTRSNFRNLSKIFSSVCVFVCDLCKIRQKRLLML